MSLSVKRVKGVQLPGCSEDYAHLRLASAGSLSAPHSMSLRWGKVPGAEKHRDPGRPCFPGHAMRHPLGPFGPQGTGHVWETVNSDTRLGGRGRVTEASVTSRGRPPRAGSGHSGRTAARDGHFRRGRVQGATTKAGAGPGGVTREGDSHLRTWAGQGTSIPTTGKGSLLLWSPFPRAPRPPDNRPQPRPSLLVNRKWPAGSERFRRGEGRERQ